MTSVTESRPSATATPTFGSDDLTHAPDDVEGRALLALSILDHRLSTRDRHADPDKRRAYITEAIHAARMALDGASVGQILAQHTGAAT
jgi:hypothetical protein